MPVERYISLRGRCSWCRSSYNCWVYLRYSEYQRSRFRVVTTTSHVLFCCWCRSNRTSASVTANAKQATETTAASTAIGTACITSQLPPRLLTPSIHRLSSVQRLPCCNCLANMNQLGLYHYRCILIFAVDAIAKTTVFPVVASAINTTAATPPVLLPPPRSHPLELNASSNFRRCWCCLRLNAIFRVYNRVLCGSADVILHGRPVDLFALLGGSLRPLRLPLCTGGRPGDDRVDVDSVRHYDNVHMGLYIQVRHMLQCPWGYFLCPTLSRAALRLGKCFHLLRDSVCHYKRLLDRSPGPLLFTTWT